MRRRSPSCSLNWVGGVDKEFLSALYQHQPRKIILFSSGGDLEAAFAAIDWINYTGGIHMIATGSCHSAAIPVFASCKKRECTPLTHFGFHRPYATFKRETFNGGDHERELQTCRRVEGIYAKILAGATKKPISYWEEAMVEERTMDAEEAIKIGLVQRIVR